VTVLKPALSAPSKPERFLVCVGFRGRDDPAVKV